MQARRSTPSLPGLPGEAYFFGLSVASSSRPRGVKRDFGKSWTSFSSAVTARFASPARRAVRPWTKSMRAARSALRLARKGFASGLFFYAATRAVASRAAASFSKPVATSSICVRAAAQSPEL